MANCTWPDGISSMPSAAPCGPVNETTPVVPCCVIGDTCLSDNICKYTHTNKGGSGYYSAGCTADIDSFGAVGNTRVCSTRCDNTKIPDIVYDATSDIWKCCGGTTGDRHCSDPTDDNFSASAPEDLDEYWVAGSLSSIAPSSTATSTPSMTNISTTTDNPSSSSSLSTGAKAGIGVGVAAGGILFFAGAYIFFRRMRSKRAHIGENGGSPHVPQAQFVTREPQELPAYGNAKRAPPQEME